MREKSPIDTRTLMKAYLWGEVVVAEILNPPLAESQRGPVTGSGRGGTGAECTIEVVVRPCGVNRFRIGSRSLIEEGRQVDLHELTSPPP